MPEKVSNLIQLRRYWLSSQSIPHQVLDDSRLQNKLLSSGQAEQLQLELSRHLLKKVAKVLKRQRKPDSDWLNAEFIRPSVNFGCPITVTSGTEDYARIQHLWLLAIDMDAAVKDEGALVLNAVKDEAPVSGIDVRKYNIHPRAVQANLLRQHVALPTAGPIPSEKALPSNDVLNSPFSASRGAGGVKVPGSPTAISATSTLRSSASSDASDSMPRAPPYCQGRADKPTTIHGSHYATRENDGLRSTPETQDYALAIHNKSAGETTQSTTSLRVTPEPGSTLQHGRHPHRYSASTTYSSSMTTVVFQAKITTGGNITEVPFGTDNMAEAVEDIMAYVDWKNSDVGHNVPVDFKTFMSIMRYRPTASNALVLHRDQ